MGEVGPIGATGPIRDAASVVIRWAKMTPLPHSEFNALSLRIKNASLLGSRSAPIWTPASSEFEKKNQSVVALLLGAWMVLYGIASQLRIH